MLLLSDLLSQLGEPAKAITYLDAIPADTAPPWRTALIRGRAHVRLDQYEQAIDPLKQATMLNPRPSEAWYLLGVVYQKSSHHEDAAAAFRKAYETTVDGRANAISDR